MRWLLCLTLLFQVAEAADWLSAMRAYEEGEYSVAHSQFSTLARLGNEQAAFNLAAMAFHGQGQPVDKVLAVAHFGYASFLGHPDAEKLKNNISQTLSADQITQAIELQNKFSQALLIPIANSPDTPLPDERAPLSGNAPTLQAKVIKQVQPEYPRNAARHGITGYVKMRFLLDAAGEVTVIDVIDSFPRHVFERESKRSLAKWQYEATGKPAVRIMQFDFSLENNGLITPELLVQQIEKHQLWLYAIAGAPQYQQQLGTLLELLHKYSRNNLRIDNTLTLDPANPDWSVFTHVTHETAKSAAVVITEMFTPHFWWRQAAKNGNYEAQRILSADDVRWRDYLAQQQDAEVMAWYGAERFIQGNTEFGISMLDSAIKLGSSNAERIKEVLLAK
ncbi:TonB family protein [Rheinheimera nanhaiensis]|uniref:Protein TonB n=1 Tax=Rheinheimera nanhaiensis E407-8 TaxID=562729 RepID=I1E2B0_9GAMM|nr:TonB family protein [Rheinheimera nanhaiensis]GAB60438.1 hypothetical protein RNAN_3462 [Rheinheimera nanhaiensis E407-8]